MIIRNQAAPGPTLLTSARVAHAARRGFGVRRLTLMGCTLFCGIAVGAGGLALAATGVQSLAMRDGDRLGRMQHMIARALDSVGASAAQEARVHDIIASKAPTFQQMRVQRQDADKAMLALLRAPAVDRDAVEKLRADQVAAFDASSKTIVAGMVDAVEQLDPEQRAKLADRVEAMMQRRRDGAWRGMGDHPMHRRDDGGEHGSSDGPDKG